MKKKISIKRRIMSILIGTLIPIIAFQIYSSFNMAQVMNQKITEAGMTALQVYAGNVDGQLGLVQDRLLESVAGNEDFTVFSNQDSDEVKTYVASYNILEEYKMLLRQNPCVTGCIIYSSGKEICRAVWSDRISGYDKKENLLKAVREHIEEENFRSPNSWEVITSDGIHYLVRTMGYRKTYAVALIDLNNLITAGEESSLLFTDGTGALTDMEFVASEGIDPAGKQESCFTGKRTRYLLIRTDIANTPVYLVYLRVYKGILSGLSRKEMYIFYISLLSLLLIPISFELLKKTFFKPVDKLVSTMNRIKDGGELSSEDTYDEIEFEQVSNTFRAMLQQIRELKIEAYEKKLQIQKTELQYYQIQIRPHFYLNCLKNIYGMLENNKNEETQKFIIYLSRHLRYMMRDKTDPVTLDEEISYIKNYIVLQELSMKYPPKCTIDGDMSLTARKIPAISILTFVENSVKYASNMPVHLEITISFSLLKGEEGDIFYISVRDNGCGFSNDQLVRLNRGSGMETDGEHIGITNVMQRFYLFYGKDRVGFAFSNADPGAKIEIFIQDPDVRSGKTEASLSEVGI